MCRLFGISLAPGGWEAEGITAVEFAQTLFPALVGGGPHAWGVMTWDGSEDIEVTKHLGRADTIRARNAMERIDPDCRWMVGHTRWATHGSPRNMLNNHPIRHDRIVGVHNGIIHNYSRILKETGRFKEGAEVDSEAIFAAVNLWGNRKGLSRIEGNMVAIYADSRHPATLHIARTHGRPIAMAWTEAGSLVWASEEQALFRLPMALGRMTTVQEGRLLYVRNGIITKRVSFGPSRYPISARLDAPERSPRRRSDPIIFPTAAPAKPRQQSLLEGVSSYWGWAGRDKIRAQARGMLFGTNEVEDPDDDA